MHMIGRLYSLRISNRWCHHTQKQDRTMNHGPSISGQVN